MNRSEPIKNPEDLRKFKEFFLKTEPNPRNYLLITTGLNTALRISDILGLCWEDVYDFQSGRLLTHLYLQEQKTKKKSQIFLNESIRQALSAYMESLGGAESIRPGDYIFKGRDDMHITRTQAYRIVRKAADACHIQGAISPHSMRKTFGYCAWKQGTPPALLIEIYHHSEYSVTKRYLCIDQDEKDGVFRDVNI